MPVDQCGPDNRGRYRRHRPVVSSDVAVREAGREIARVIGGQSSFQSLLPLSIPPNGATVSLRQNRAAGAQVRAHRCVVSSKHLFQRQVKVREVPIVSLREAQINTVSPRYPVARQDDWR
jgi:hypothetical protein